MKLALYLPQLTTNLQELEYFAGFTRQLPLVAAQIWFKLVTRGVIRNLLF